MSFVKKGTCPLRLIFWHSLLGRIYFLRPADSFLNHNSSTPSFRSYPLRKMAQYQPHTLEPLLVTAKILTTYYLLCLYYFLDTFSIRSLYFISPSANSELNRILESSLSSLLLNSRTESVIFKYSDSVCKWCKFFADGSVPWVQPCKTDAGMRHSLETELTETPLFFSSLLRTSCKNIFIL